VNVRDRERLKTFTGPKITLFFVLCEISNIFTEPIYFLPVIGPGLDFMIKDLASVLILIINTITLNSFAVLFSQIQLMFM